MLQQIEWLPVVNPQGIVIGKSMRNKCHQRNSILHPVIHLHIFNSKGDLFLQKRPQSKVVQPGKWDTAVGGHVSFGDDILKALEREAKEELNIEIEKKSFITKYLWQTEIESELIYVFYANWDQNIYVNKDELDDGRFWTLSELRNHINKDTFTPNLKFELKTILISIISINA